LFIIQADIDNSGTIDYGEFIAAMLHLNKVQKEDHLFAAFNYFDKDGSGYITKDELQKACEQFGLQEDHLDDIIREADKDNVMNLNFLTPCFSNITFTSPLLYIFHPFPSNHPLHFSSFCFLCIYFKCV
jgi:Ca2+-binding EF-hand superfamily protein